MKIPKTIDKRDRDRLRGHLKNYTILNKILANNTPPKQDLLKMLRLEAERPDGYRLQCVQKIIGRLTTCTRKELWRQVDDICQSHI